MVKILFRWKHIACDDGDGDDGNDGIVKEGFAVDFVVFVGVGVIEGIVVKFSEAMGE